MSREGTVGLVEAEVESEVEAAVEAEEEAEVEAEVEWWSDICNSDDQYGGWLGIIKCPSRFKRKEDGLRAWREGWWK